MPTLRVVTGLKWKHAMTILERLMEKVERVTLLFKGDCEMAKNERIHLYNFFIF